MKRIDVKQNTDEWFAQRKGKITGSKLKDVLPKTRGSGKKIGFYQLIADSIAVEADEEDVRDRGHRLEDEAIELFELDQGVKVERVGLVVSDDNERIAISPDGLVKGKHESVEVKCLSSARHLEAVIENEAGLFVPSDFEYQIMQGFIVDPQLKKKHLVFYDPRVQARPYLLISIPRSYWTEDHLQSIKLIEEDTLAEVDEWIERLSF